MNWSAVDSSIRAFIDDEAPALNPIADHLAPVVVSAIKDWLANGTIAPEIDTLATDSAILAFVSSKVQTIAVNTLHLPTEIGAVVGTAAADLIRNTLGGSGNANVRAVIDSVAGTLAPTDQQATGTLAGLTGGDIQPLEDFIGLKLSDAGRGLLGLVSDPGVRSALALPPSTR